jgi:hypothetical protein
MTMKFKFKQPSNFASLEKMSDDALAKYYDKRQPLYRKALSKLTSFLKMFFGRVFSAFASETIIDVSGGGESAGGSKTSANGLTVEKFKAPGPRALRGYIDDLESIDYINELAYQMDRAAASESKALRAQLKSIEKMRNALVDAYVAAMDAMESVAQKHIPDAVGAIFKGASETARTLLPEDFELGSYLYVGVNGKEADFVLNIDLSTEDDTKSLVVVTARLVPVDDHFEIRVYVNHLEKMALPGQYNIGTNVEGADVKAIVKKLKPAIEHEISLTHVVNLLGAIAIPVDETEIEKKLLAIEGVEGVSFEQDESDAVTAIHFEVPGISSDDNEVAKSARAAAFRVISANNKVKALVRKQYSLNLVNDEDHCTITLTHKG